MKKLIFELGVQEEAATAVEYALLLAFITAAVIGTVSLIGPKLVPGFQTVVSALP